MKNNKTIKLVIDNEVLNKYNDYYFGIHKRATNKPIKHPYHESINVWMILKRAMMNALKQRWKDFIVWFVEDQGYANLHIDKCDIEQVIYYPNNRRHDTDNSTPKFILDGLVMSGMIVDDDMKHVLSLLLKCDTDTENPRTELYFYIKE